jgi:outer membrane cobalamin receptor
MKKNLNLGLLAVLLLVSATVFGQVSGTVTDVDGPLSGVNVVIKGTDKGTSTDFDGKFVIQTDKEGELLLTYIGYKPVTVAFKAGDKLEIIMENDGETLETIVITGSGVIDLAKDRKTPIAVSTIKASVIQEKSGNFDLPELLTETPSVQVSKEGGYGDAQMSIRGFSQINTAFLLNGQPINGMEDGKMYWSNWSGILDIANAVQVQRGLGSSKLAISSVGGTVNIVTKTVDTNEGGFISGMVANDNYYKTSVYYSTGLMDNGLAVSAMFGHWQGDGYRNGTLGQGQTYFLSFGYKPNDNNIFNFLVTGAPQWHGDAWTVDLQTYLDKGRKFNGMYGYKDGKEHPGARNFYHKPIMNLSWDWTISDVSSLSTVLYGSIGRGGYAYPSGALWGKVSGEDGGIDFDAQVAENEANGNSTGYMRGSYNGHNWYGVLSNFSTELNENISLNLGGDIRLYNGIHFRAPTDLLGGNGVSVNHNGQTFLVDNVYGGYNPWQAVFNFNDSHEQRIKRDYSENINYYGVFGQVEYSKDKFSTFFQGSVSNQDHQRTEYWYVADLNTPEESEKVSNMGYNIKGGLAYELSENSKIFGNAGYYSRQPFHDDLFVSGSRSNELNTPPTENEKVVGLELGYNKKGENYNFNVNLYSTEWGNRTRRQTNAQDNTWYDVITGITEIHKGIEIDGSYSPTDKLKLRGFISLGDWKFDGIAEGKTFDADGNLVSGATPVELDLDGANVRGAQTTAGIFVDYKFAKNFRFDIGQKYYGNNHGNINNVTGDAIKLPGYTLIDAGLSYKHYLKGSKSLSFRVNVNNLMDEFYISSAKGTTPVTSSSANVWHGVDTSNNVRIGYGRTWNASVRFKF